jgi:copper chaperone
MQLKIEDMSCGGCVSNITEALEALDSNVTVVADLESRSVEVSSTASEAQIREALENAGYPAS